MKYNSLDFSHLIQSQKFISTLEASKFTMLSPSARKEKTIRATDLDALSSRFSANKSHYFEPEDVYIQDLVSSYHKYLQYCEGYTQLSAGRTLRSVFNERKLPIINRGTYLRTRLIDLVLNEFIKKFGDCQIVSLGGGSDTRFIHLLANHKQLKYHEIDFPESTKIKKLALLANSNIRNLLDLVDLPPTITSKEEFANFSPNICTSRYNLIGMDLRKLSVEKLSTFFDSKLPTIVLSECVLCYLSPEENESIISVWKEWASNFISFLIYEPMSLSDSFGSTMSKNLIDRGIDLQSFAKYPTLKSRFEFLNKICNLKNVRLTEMSHVGGFNVLSNQSRKPWLDENDIKRLNKLEFIDEVEEIRMLYEHYCLCYGDNSDSNTLSGLDKWEWSLT